MTWFFGAKRQEIFLNKEVSMVKKRITKKAKRSKRNSRYICEACGMIVTVDNVCNCVDACDIICCGKEMKPKK